MRRQDVLKIAAPLAVALTFGLVACLDKDRDTQSKTTESSLRCSLGPDVHRGYARLVYFKYAGLCVGKGKYNGEHTVQENVTCKLYEDADATGLIKIINGTVNATTRDCTFTVDETGSLLVSRNGDGDTIATSTDPSLAGAMTCAAATVTLDADDGCTTGLLPRAAYDTTAEGTANGVQAACDGASKCTEYFNLTDDELTRQQGLCADTWRPGACSTAWMDLKSGCEKAMESGGRRLIWEKNTARESCDD